MSYREGGRLSNEHAEVYHAASGCQAASLSLTPRRLHDHKMACSLERQKSGDFASQEQAGSGCPGDVETFCFLEDRSLIGFLLLPHGKNNAHPHVCQGSYSHTMAFSLRAFTLVIRSCPRLKSRGLPDKLLHGIAQRFDTGVALMHLGVVATLIPTCVPSGIIGETMKEGKKTCFGNQSHTSHCSFSSGRSQTSHENGFTLLGSRTLGDHLSRLDEPS